MIIRVEKKKNTNTHEYSRIRKNIIYDNSWIFMIIHVEKKKNTNTHEYTRMNTNTFFEHELPEITHEFFKNYL